MLVFHKTPNEMAGPYLAYAVPGPIFLLVVLGLRTWEDRGGSPKRLAIAWTLCTTLFMFIILGATVYSGAKLHLIDPNDAVGILVVACVGGALIGPFMMYRRVLKVTTARVAERKDEVHPK
jgi:predicted Na+-dependent transporter